MGGGGRRDVGGDERAEINPGEEEVGLSELSACRGSLTIWMRQD